MKPLEDRVFVIYSLGLTGPRSVHTAPEQLFPKLSMYHELCGVWGNQDPVGLAELKCLLTSFPWCGGFNPDFISVEPQKSANEKAVAF